MAEDFISQLLAATTAGVLPSVDAVSVGGSTGRGESDEGSDVDMFVLLNVPDLFLYARNQLRTYLRGLSEVAVTRGPVFVDGFGYSCTLAFMDLSVCQLNFNNRSSIQTSPDLASNRVLLDLSGTLASLQQASRAISREEGDLFAQTFRYFWLRALLAIPTVHRGENWRTLRYLTDLRDAMATTLRLQSSRLPPQHMRGPTTRLEEDVGAGAMAALGFSLGGLTSQENAVALQKCARWFTTTTTQSPYYHLITSQERTFAGMVIGELECLSRQR